MFSLGYKPHWDNCIIYFIFEDTFEYSWKPELSDAFIVQII